MNASHRCGLVTLIGRPNVGKSTLLNRLVGSKISITSSRAQTTRHRLLGIKTTPEMQIIYVDTPGLHASDEGIMNRYMNRAASGSLEGVDCIVLLINSGGWEEADEYPLRLAMKHKIPVILAINKVDLVKDRSRLLPLIKLSGEKADFTEIVPLSARVGTNVAELEHAIIKYLPEQPAIYPADQITDRSERFLAEEMVREQVFRSFRQEVPYATAVQVEQFKRVKGVLHIDAIIWVEKEGQKGILIGKAGAGLKNVGSRARIEMQKFFGSKVHLNLWVKVREGWSDNARSLRSLGYTDES